MPGLLAMAGEPTVEMLERMQGAQAHLEQAGFDITTQIVPGVPEEAIPALLQSHGNVLLVLGAYGHSRIRQLIVGSTTTALLRLCTVPVVVLH
jgi:nucleotide-binding universal stress UspA family protein